MLRVIAEARPRFVLAENVVGIINMALDTVLSDLESEGYTAGTVVLPACGLNALHKRSRVWVLADSNRKRGCSGDLPREHAVNACESPGGEVGGFWDAECPFCRVAHGIPDKTHRIAALGNSIVPQVAREILKGLIKSYE
jgi:DNA (cytosine-5)-methyltransferase 1